ncbi:hypothetical protein CIB48_g11912, partial [Xylaria polymorpha]
MGETRAMIWRASAASSRWTTQGGQWSGEAAGGGAEDGFRGRGSLLKQSSVGVRLESEQRTANREQEQHKQQRMGSNGAGRTTNGSGDNVCSSIYNAGLAIEEEHGRQDVYHDVAKSALAAAAAADLPVSITHLDNLYLAYQSTLGDYRHVLSSDILIATHRTWGCSLPARTMASLRGGYTPSLEKFLDTLKSRPVEASVELLISLFKRRQIKGSEACATATAHILLQVVAKDRWTNVDQLLGRIQLIGRKLVAAQPHELVIGNIVRRVLGLIRDEASEDRNDATTDSPRAVSPHPAAPPSHASSPAKPVRPPILPSLGSFARTQSMFNLLSDPSVLPSMGSNASTPGQVSGASTPILNPQTTNVSALRSEVIDGIQEIMDEIKMVDEQVQTYADIFIHPGDYILVHQPSRTVQKFLTRAASKRKFTVFLVVDPASATSSDEQYASLHKSMSSNGSSLITVQNAGLMAYMSRVDKVILGARAITAQGGVIVDSGAAAIARAARERRRTVIVLGGVYKLSPESKFLPESQVEWGEPSKYVNFADGPMVSQIKVKNAISEFLPADQIDTYITNLGAHAQDNLHAIITDHYKEEDIDFDLYLAQAPVQTIMTGDGRVTAQGWRAQSPDDRQPYSNLVLELVHAPRRWAITIAMEPHNGLDCPPPPYSETDIYSHSHGSRNHQSSGADDDESIAPSSSNSNIIFTPPESPRDTQYSFAGPSSDQHSTTSAQAYFDSRPPNRPPGPNITISLEVTPDASPSDFPYPKRALDRDITEQDWQTFINYLIPEHAARANSHIIDRKLRAAGDSQPSASDDVVEAQLAPLKSSENPQNIDAVTREWNHGFFEPRGVTIRQTLPAEPAEPAEPTAEEAQTPQNEASRAASADAGQNQSQPEQPDSWWRQQPGSWWRNPFGSVDANNGSLHIGPLHVEGDRVALGSTFEADRNGVRWRGGPNSHPLFEASSRGVHWGEQPGPIPGHPHPFDHHRGGHPWAGPFGGRGRGRDREHGHGRRDHSRNSTSSSSSLSSSDSDSSIGSLPDWDSLKDTQLPVTKRSVQGWLSHPDQPVTKVMLKQAKAEIKAAKSALPPPRDPSWDQARESLRREVKDLLQQFKVLKRQQKATKRATRKELRQQKRAARQERRERRRAEKHDRRGERATRRAEREAERHARRHR